MNDELEQEPVHIASRVHAWLGRVFIAPPEALRMPPWFYFVQADRPQPRVDEFNSGYERTAIAVDMCRRNITRRMGPIAVAVSVAMSTVLLIANALITTLSR